MSLTQKRLKGLLRYSKRTGLFAWLVTRNGFVAAGDIAGSTDGLGYVTISIDHVRYKAHRLAWFYVTGAWPKRMTDHEDTNPSNNRWKNLREATPVQNTYNARRRKDNTSGLKGVGFKKENGKWHASIRHFGKLKHLGYFATAKAAHKVYAAKAIELRGEYARV